ncbi:MAG: hypothetical protein ACPGWR_31335 [Ardenticatenaceae bacterium]
MSDIDYWAEMKIKIKSIVKWLSYSFLDAVFLSGWVALQWFVSEIVIKNLQLSGLDEYILLSFQYLFSWATLLPIIAHIFIDSWTITLRTLTELWKEYLLFRQATSKDDIYAANKRLNVQDLTDKKEGEDNS